MQSAPSSASSMSAAQFLSMLNDSILEKQVFALRKISQVVDHQWHEISDQLPKIEELMDQDNFPEKQLAASVASKVFYYLDEADDALKFALEAGVNFDIYEDTQYAETLISKCIDIYIDKRVKLVDQKEVQTQIDPRMEDIINKKFNQCFSESNFKHVIGIALQSRRIDSVQQAIEKCADPEAMLGYVFTIAMDTIQNQEFRTKVLRMILLIYERRQSGEGRFDYYKIAKCQYHLGLPESLGDLLIKLLNSDSDTDYLIAYQIAFDLVDKEQQTYTTIVMNNIENKASSVSDQSRLSTIKSIIKGEVKDRLNLQFLKKNNNTDMLLIQRTKDSIGNRNSMLHSATIWQNGIMNAYTTNDTFLRDNLAWTSTATNWNRFQATASLGMIHGGNKAQAQEILNPYFHGTGENPSPYSCAGAYYAYGLIHANTYTPENKEFMMAGYNASGQNESIQHGVSLGLGLVAMATNDQDCYQTLRDVLFNNADSAIIGEAAAYGMGLVLTGSGNEAAIEEMLSHASDSNHEKIIRALGISLALLMYGKESVADGLIEQMCQSKDATIRYGAMFTIGCAYAGTGNTQAIQKLLKCAVSDVSDDVKRVALINMGFLCFRKQSILPNMVKYLAESYNPHLRYGAALAVGIGCAGSGSQEALRLLAPLTKDSIDFVKQGAVMALSLVFIQVTEAQEPKVDTINKLFKRMTENKHEETLTRMGAILATGILNAGGRNATISMTTRDGNLRQNAIVGLVLFLQHWYWYPMLNFVTLALTPTALICVEKTMKVPKQMQMTSKAKPSMFRYPVLMTKADETKKEKIETVTLSTTAKVKARKNKKDQVAGVDVEMQSQVSKKKEGEDKEKEEEEKKEEDKKEEEPEKPEPEFLIMSNPCRVLKAQEQKMVYDQKDGRFAPLLQNRFSGFVVLKQTKDLGEGEKEEYYDDEERNLDAPNPDLASDLQIPKAFEFDPAVQDAAE